MSADEVPARPAASLILVRDAPGLQVLMGTRPLSAKAFPGALVFPGGKVELQDADPIWRVAAEGPAAPEELFALRIAAIRETFEETGLLLASDARGRRPAGEVVEARVAVTAAELDFRAWLDGQGLRPDAGALVPFARWITPLGQRYRFDTWFFIAEAGEREPEPSATEEFASLGWMDVQGVVEDVRLGRRDLLFPTRTNLGLLAESRSAAAAVEAARARTVVPVRPEAGMRDGRTVMTIRADAAGDVADALGQVEESGAGRG